MVNWLHRLSFTLFPGICQLCAAPSARRRDLCAGCEADLPWLGRHCRCCALPLESGELCGRCLQKPPVFQRCHAAWEYAYPVDRLITGFKHHRRHAGGALLADLWLERVAPRLDRPPDLLLPVPLHWRRQLSRGFNQADSLARRWGHGLGIPVARPVKRIKATPAQQQLSAPARRGNLRGAFALTDTPALVDRHIAIVDDVLTTGATVNALAAILGRAGAARVDVWCLARTP